MEQPKLPFEGSSQNNNSNFDIPSEFLDRETIMDSTHKLVKISQFEKDIISSPEFQRLRRIKQLGFVNLVFSTAEHSRFVHSIGVCHQAKFLTQQVNENITNSKRFQIWRDYGTSNLKDKNGQKKKLKSELKHLLITPAEKIIISVAALLHDISHSPFSHEIESPTGNKHEIPVHDDFDKNPVFFRYLFDTSHSQLAKVILYYNKIFYDYIKKDDKWRDELPKGIIDNEGMVTIPLVKEAKEIIDKKAEDFPVINGGISEKSGLNIDKLPLLGMMIFEIHLFDKSKDWIKLNTHKDQAEENYNTKKVEIDWSPSSDKNDKSTEFLYWRPLYGWFRPYRKDIITDTICADLLDYIVRDGTHTGIISAIDFKFLDRMAIARTAYLADDRNVRVRSGSLLSTFEHIVFDTYDHKRGELRGSIITEILTCLQARYQLAERVYGHRVVEGARSMLQIISSLLSKSGALSIKDLHSCNTDSSENYPTGDDTLLSWIISQKNILGEKDENAKADIRSAIQLTEHLRDRRIYREAVIINGGTSSLKPNDIERKCQELVDSLLIRDDQTDKKQRYGSMLNEINKILRKAYEKNNDNSTKLPSRLATIGVKKYGKRYKIPTVLIAVPQDHPDENGDSHLDITPLFVFDMPISNTQDRLKAMKAAYDDLWKIYLFLHPAFHSLKYEDAHIEVEKVFLRYINESTGVEWENSIKYFEELLPDKSIDQHQFLIEELKTGEKKSGTIALLLDDEVKEWAEKILDGVLNKIEHPTVNSFKDKRKIKARTVIIDDFIADRKNFPEIYKQKNQSELRTKALGKISEINLEGLFVEGTIPDLNEIYKLIGKELNILLGK